MNTGILLTALLLAAGLQALAAAERAPLRIMPLGDSGVVGFTDNPAWKHPFAFGFRGGLYRRLAAAGREVRFVGGSAEPFNRKFGDPTHGGKVTPPMDLRPLGQDGHRGYGGVGIATIQAGVAGWMQEDRPDLILLLIGSNGIGPASPGQLDTLVQTIFATDPAVKLVVAQIFARIAYHQGIVDYNAHIRGTLVPAWAAKGAAIATVDLYEPFLGDPADLRSIDPARFSNAINHPTNAVYERMAERWYEAVEALLAQGGRKAGP